MTLFEQIQTLIHDAPEASAVQQIQHTRDQLKRQLRLGQITVDEYQQQIVRYSTHVQLLVPYPSVVYGIFRVYLGQTPEIARRSADHEIAHYLRAKALGCQNLRFGFLFYKETQPDGMVNYFCQPSLIFDLPPGVTTEQASQIIEQIFSEPDELSKSDKFVLRSEPAEPYLEGVEANSVPCGAEQ